MLLRPAGMSALHQGPAPAELLGNPLSRDPAEPRPAPRPELARLARISGSSEGGRAQNGPDFEIFMFITVSSPK